MIKIAHESPKSIFKEIQSKTDYDYALVHLFEEDPEYLNLFKESLSKGREVILDNSIFELGTAFEMERFMYWVKELEKVAVRPNQFYYIIPDSLEDYKETVTNFEKFVRDYGMNFVSKGRPMAVAQGRTVEEISDCVSLYKKYGVTKIGIPYDLSLYSLKSVLQEQCRGRVALIGKLQSNGILSVEKDKGLLHLLGVSLPQEGSLIGSSEVKDLIGSVDTSNPVVHGLKNIRYSGLNGLSGKETTKLFTLINSVPTTEELSAVKYNVDVFREIFGKGKGGLWPLEFCISEMKSCC